MNRISAVGSALVLGCAFFSSSARSAEAATSAQSRSLQAAIVASVEKERKLYGGRTQVPAVLVGVWDGAGGSYIRAFGYADLAKRRPLTADDHFRIGSNTKTFVISVLLQLVDEGKLRLDDPLSRFSLGVKVPNARNITIRQLCQMRSGLFEVYDSPQFSRMNITPKMTFDSRRIIKWALEQKPYFAPGKGYHYSNTNYLLLGLVIENITKDTVGNEIRRRILVPFHLTATSYPSTQMMPNPWAHGYSLDKRRNWKDVSGTIPVSLMGAAGEMISDMNDMQHWVKLYVTGKTNGPSTQRARMSCIDTGEGNLSFGLGIGCSAGWYGYTGGLPGYNTANYYFPATNTTIVAWVPFQADTPAPGVANAIFRAIARIMTPGNIPFLMTRHGAGRSGL
ncbi:MAG: beta-lactamase family protein [Candidatus Eremiobacteraeota bacterium]|nr:beta-lactamase family protein [Candidatus Eremiobacteraeota bacterium]